MEEIDDFIWFRTANRWLRWYVDDCIVCSCQKKMMLGKVRKKMNIIRNVFRDLFQPIQVEARFPLMAWVLLLLAVIIATISKIEIICQ